jgi:predicted RNase H-like nuclease (RuvC/YqgF family)
METKRKLSIALILPPLPLMLMFQLTLPSPAYAEVYKIIDKHGKVTYSSTPPSKDAKPAKLPELTTMPAFKAKPDEGDTNKTSVAKREENERRRKTVQEQLANEEKLLAEAVKTYNNGEPERLGDEKNFQKYQDRVADLKVKIAQHESRVDALKSELAQIGSSSTEETSSGKSRRSGRSSE